MKGLFKNGIGLGLFLFVILAMIGFFFTTFSSFEIWFFGIYMNIGWLAYVAAAITLIILLIKKLFLGVGAFIGVGIAIWLLSDILGSAISF